jgi:hypothetical protein
VTTGVAVTGSTGFGAGSGSTFNDIGAGTGIGRADFGVWLACVGAPAMYDQVTGNRNVAP